ncbi:MAG: 16S rRNA (adenine(1518)-N(6)/adenine(1519)-N(6))-dimethyltransferase RsmA [Tepidisphaeraceae bacterium]
MAQTKHEIHTLLESIGVSPRKRFGQNFMIDQNLVRVVADAGEIRSDDVVIEVGPGTGTLTEELLSRGARVVAVEIDRDLAKLLRERFASHAKFELIEGDALCGKHDLNPELRASLAASQRDARPVKLIANLPYNIASPLIIELLIAGTELLAFTVQKEVAQRLRATESDDAYGPLSVMARLLCRVEVLRTLPPQAFWPAPKVESALVRMGRDDQLGNRAPDFSRFIHQIFSARRKTMRNAITKASLGPALLDEMKIDPKLRPENLSPAQYLELFDASRRSPRA